MRNRLLACLVLGGLLLSGCSTPGSRQRETNRKLEQIHEDLQQIHRDLEKR